MTDNKKTSNESNKEISADSNEKEKRSARKSVEKTPEIPNDSSPKKNEKNTSQADIASTMKNKPASSKKNTTQKTSSKASSQIEAKATPPAASKKAKSNRPIGQRSIISKLFWLIIVVIVIAAAAYGAWQFWLLQDKRFQQAQDVSVQQYQQLQSAINEKNAALEKQLADQQEQFALLVQQSSKEQQILQQRLDVQLEKINTLSGVSRDGWMLEEARHLLRLATQRQLTGSSASSIVGLLEAADNTLRDIDIPDLFIVREQIQNDMVALKIMPNIDREGMYLQLSALIDQVSQLPAAPLTPPQKKSSAEDSAKETSSELNVETNTAPNLWQAIKQRVNHTLSSLDNYIRITHHDEAIKPVLSNSQRAVTQENIRLLLVQAQVALLREENTIYQQSLNRATRLLNKHYAHYEKKSSLVNMLKALEQRTIISKLPNVSSSLNILNQYIDVYKSQPDSNDQNNNPKDNSAKEKNDTEVIQQEAL